MAEDTEKLSLLLEARVTDLERGMARASKAVGGNWKAIEDRTSRASRFMERTAAIAAQRVNASLSSVGRNAAAGLAGFMGIRELQRMADGWQMAANKIAAAGENISDVARRESQLADIAIRNRTEFSAVADLYAGMKRSTADLGTNTETLLRLTDGISKGFAISGTSVGTAAGAILQLNQAFAAGALRGEEFNSVNEGAPIILEAIAAKLGVARGQLKALASEGKITTPVIIEALMEFMPEIEARFSRTSATIGQSFTNLQTALTRYVGQADQANGASRKIAGGIQTVADNVDIAVPAVAVLGNAFLAFRVGGPIAAGVTAVASALYLFGDSINPIAGDLATLGDYGRVAFDLIETHGGEAAAAISTAFASASDLITAALSSPTGENTLAAIKAGLNTIIGAYLFAGRSIIATWNNLGGVIGEGVITVANHQIETFEKMLNQIVAALNAVMQSISDGAKSVGVNIELGTIAPVNLGRIESQYAGAGEAAAKAYSEAFDAFSTDYVGTALATVDGAMGSIRAAANALAEDRAEVQRKLNMLNARRTDSSGTPAPPPPGAGTSKPSAPNAYQREIATVERSIAALELERAALGSSEQAATKAKIAFELLNAAKAAGLTITPALKAQIDQLAGSYARVSSQLDQAKQRQATFDALNRQFASSLSDVFDAAILRGERLGDVLGNLASQLASEAFRDLMTILITGNPGTGIVSNALSVLILADGGPVRGPGSSRSDSIPAMLSDGEFVVNSKAAGQHRQLLEAMNSGNIRGFADGGFVGARIPALPALGSSRPAITIAPTINLHAQGGSPTDNADLAERFSKQIENTMRQVVADELSIAMRPGGVLNH